jgi:hypothetical protein
MKLIKQLLIASLVAVLSVSALAEQPTSVSRPEGAEEKADGFRLYDAEGKLQATVIVPQVDPMPKSPEGE